MMLKKLVFLGLLITGLLSGLVLSANAHDDNHHDPVGLSLFFQNGVMAPVTLVGDPPRYLQEIDLVATTEPSQEDLGLQPLKDKGELASLDWSGVERVDEDWRPAGDGTFIRQRFYRQARWMERPSHFRVVPTDDAGRPVGSPLLADAGKDEQFDSSDDGFVRRFSARQIATGCRAQGDCTGAKFVVQGLVQLRNALHAERRSRVIPPQATRLSLSWSEQPSVLRTVPITHAAPASFQYGYGFQPALEVINPPANSHFYRPGETVRFRVTFRDGDGRRLHPQGSLPTYGQFLRGEVPSGLRYYNGFALFPTTYYALKHREGLMAVSLLGPLDRVKTPRTTVAVEEFGGSQAAFATPAVDGFTSLFADIPPNPIVFGGDPADDDTPVSDVVSFTIPREALAGTYVAALKARREWAGEALKRAVSLEIQVGTVTPTPFVAKTGPCNTCHTGPSSLPNLLHGLSDRRTCFACHSSLAFEPDAAIDIRVHRVHDRSKRFTSLASITNCALCHLTPPTGPARGLLSHSSGKTH